MKKSAGVVAYHPATAGLIFAAESENPVIGLHLCMIPPTETQA